MINKIKKNIFKNNLKNFSFEEAEYIYQLFLKRNNIVINSEDDEIEALCGFELSLRLPK